MSRILRHPILPALLAGAVLMTPLPAHAQTDAFRACYVPGSGTVYRVGAPDTRAGCAAGHVPFSWAGMAQLSTAASAASAANDPYPQYLLANGVRQSTNGFAVTGTLRPGAIPASGQGTRLMWYPGKAAFRAGHVDGSQWNDTNIGHGSTALGVNATASGKGATALGDGATAAGTYSMALGGHTFASGIQSTALGHGAQASGMLSSALGSWAIASGTAATSLGHITIADGPRSMALGSYASTGGKTGAFVYGDASINTHVQATANNQFVVRAQHIWLGRNNNVGTGWGGFLETSTGASLSWGGTWTNSSDVAKKANFVTVDVDDVLEKLAAMPIRTWNYKDEAATVRHMGPTSQDFSAAFGLGSTDKAIATVDADGVALAAIQALEKRTAALGRENDALRAELARVLERIAALEAAQRLR